MRSAKHNERIASGQEGFKKNRRTLISTLYHDRFWAVEQLPVYVKMQSAKHDKRIVSDQKSF